MSSRVSLTTVVSVNPYGAAFLMTAGQRCRTQHNQGLLVTWAGQWRYLPKGDYPIVPCDKDHWRPYVGGLLVYVRVPALDGTAEEPDRVVLTFDDPGAARRVHVLEREALRHTAFLKFVDGRWYVTMKWKTKEGLKAVQDKRGREKWVRAKKVKRWGAGAAPEGWPRDKYGHPLTNRQAYLAGFPGAPYR